jgi:hypothetical protein
VNILQSIFLTKFYLRIVRGVQNTGYGRKNGADRVEGYHLPSVTELE